MGVLMSYPTFMPKRLDEDQARAFAESRGMTPLEPYPGVSHPWRCRHACGEIIQVRLNNLRRAKYVCHCLRDRSAEMKATAYVQGLRATGSMRQRIPDADAESAMIARGFIPQAPYPGASSIWRCIHVECGGSVQTRYSVVMRGQGGCRSCGSRRKGDAILKATAGKALEDMAAFGYQPLEDYPGTNAKWLSVHLGCGRESSPKLSNLRAGQGGCVPCGDKKSADSQRTPEADAVADMRRYGLEPLEPYPGTNKPWKCRHSCGWICTPTRGTVVRGVGICSRCADHGFDRSAPALLYLIHRDGVAKVGVTSVNRRRLAVHAADGWRLIAEHRFDTGVEAVSVERSILDLWKSMGAAPALDKASMPQAGHTETVRISDIDLDQTITIIGAES